MNNQKRFKSLIQTNQPQIDLTALNLTEINISIFGKRGFGKSTMAKFLLRQISHKKTIFVFDSLMEYDGDFIFDTYGSFSEYLYNEVDTEFPHLPLKTYICRFGSDEEYENLFAIARRFRNIHLIVEETDKFSKPTYIDEDYLQIIKYGRHYNQNYIAISRRPAEIKNDIISQSHIVISFRQTLPIDLKTLSQYGFSDDLQYLEQFEYEALEI